MTERYPYASVYMVGDTMLFFCVESYTLFYPTKATPVGQRSEVFSTAIQKTDVQILNPSQDDTNEKQTSFTLRLCVLVVFHGE